MFNTAIMEIMEGIPVDDPAYFTFDHEWSLLNFLLYRQQCSDFLFDKHREHDRYVRSLTAILSWEQAPEAANVWTNKALAILQGEKKSQSIAKFWENVASVEDQRMAAIARRRVVVEEHTTTVTQSVFGQDQIIRDNYTRHLEDDDKRQEKTKQDPPTKRMKIDEYFSIAPQPLHGTPFAQAQDENKINVDPLDLDVERKENSYFQELSSVENLTIEKLLKSKSSIARYRIIFLPECNIRDPIKRLYTSQEWLKMELDWEKMEEKITSSLPSFADNMQSLLNKYSKSITDASIGYYVDLNKVETTISQSPFADQHSYLFVRDWPLRWTQQLYTAFLTCLQTPINPLNDADASEYAYRSRLINHLWEDVFFDVNCVIRMKTGEVENVDRRNQLGLARNPDERKSSAGSWHHDAILIMKVGDKDVQVAFGEVVGNAFKHDDTKMYEDREKILKAMQLALFNLRKLLPEKEPGLEDLETFGLLVYKKEVFIYSMHLVDGIYLVDQFSGFAIPDAPLQLGNLPDIVRVMIMFKHRVIKLRQHMESLYRSKKSFKRGGTRHANDSTVYASPQKKSLK